MFRKKLQFILALLFFAFEIQAQPIAGAEQTDLYFSKIAHKRVGIVANQTSTIGKIHLVDSLRNAGFDIKMIFSPEHGFRGQAEAGETIQNGHDSKTGIEVVSLYGSNKKPKAEDLTNLDILIFDIQDVGVRFYTYISTLAYVMEACAENDIPVLILDRPNPHGNYVDGPILDLHFQSFVGLFPIPVVHGLTLGELALMINGESWLKNKIQCKIDIIPIQNYTHQSIYSPPISPSPNLPNENAIALYPSLCFFEGTALSIGRGTDFPFQVIGYPQFTDKSFQFTPHSIAGKSEHPNFENTACFGVDLRNYTSKNGRPEALNLSFLLQLYESYPDKANFFNDYFKLLAGTDQLQKQIENGCSENEIRKSWEADLFAYKTLRKKYLLYAD
jgi:uncharacterized protein YbbC (DUF1343 family)